MSEVRLARDNIDPQYNSLYRIGGAALILTGLAYFLCFGLTLTIPAGSGSAASYLQDTSASLGLVAALWCTYIVSDLLLIAGLLALFFVLRERSRALLLIGTGMVAAYLAFDLGITEPNWLALVSLAHSYAGASGAAQQSYAAAAEYALALAPFVNALSFAVSGAGFLLISIVMMGSVFGLRTASFGVLTMVLALVASISWFVPVLGLVVLVVLVMFGFWCVLVGAQLYRVGARMAGAAGVSVGVPRPVAKSSALPVH